MAKELRDYQVTIFNLAYTKHEFRYNLGAEFLQLFGNQEVEKCAFEARVELTRDNQKIEAWFFISGEMELLCDRSLEPFSHAVHVEKRVLFKFADQYEEVSDELVYIPRNTQVLDIGHYLYEFILLEIPMKKIHPDYREESDEEDWEYQEDFENEVQVYSTGESEDEAEEDQPDIDPRWEALKNLKDKNSKKG